MKTGIVFFYKCLDFVQGEVIDKPLQCHSQGLHTCNYNCLCGSMGVACVRINYKGLHMVLDLALTSTRICNMWLVWDDWQIHITIVSIFLVIFGAHTYIISFVVKVKTFSLNKRTYSLLPPNPIYVDWMSFKWLTNSEHVVQSHETRVYLVCIPRSTPKHTTLQ